MGRVQAIAMDIIRRGHGIVIVSGPEKASKQVIDILSSESISRQNIVKRPSRENHVDIIFNTYEVKTPDCGKFTSDGNSIGSAYSDNRTSSEWGCSTQKNLSAIISDPLDLVRMRGTTQPTNGDYAAQSVIEGVDKFALGKAEAKTGK